MSTRDELRDLVYDAIEWAALEDVNLADHITDTVRAAGYSRPRVVETVEELKALPEGSVVTWDDYGNQTVAVIGEEDYIEHTANDYWNSRLDRIGLPATVIHLPERTP